MAIERKRAQTPDTSGLSEFAPRERVTKEVQESHDFIKPGWAVGKNRYSNSGEKADYFSIKKFEEEIIIKFLDDVSFAPVFQHWVLMEGGKRRPFTCIVKECPLCERGDTPKSCDYINLVELSAKSPDDEKYPEPVLKLWSASPSPAAAIKQRAENKRSSPINRKGLYFAAFKVNGKNDIPEYHLDPVREDELDDYAVQPLTDEQLAKFNSEKYDKSVVKVHTKSELEEIAEKYLED